MCRTNFFFSHLSHVKLGSVLCNGVRMVCKNCATRLVVNKSVSERIRLFSSVRQGCPLSPLLFCTFLDPFCLSITQSEFIRRFQLQATKVRILSYADDVAMFRVEKESVIKAIELSKMLCDNTCSSVNWE